MENIIETPLFSFNHIALSVKDVDRSVHFYQKLFAFKEIDNTASDSKTRWLLLDTQRQLHLIPRPNQKITTTKAVHFALSTNNLDAFIKQLDYLKIPYSNWRDEAYKIQVRNDGIRQVYFQDPDDYWIEVNDDQ